MQVLDLGGAAGHSRSRMDTLPIRKGTRPVRVALSRGHKSAPSRERLPRQRWTRSSRSWTRSCYWRPPMSRPGRHPSTTVYRLLDLKWMTALGAGRTSWRAHESSKARRRVCRQELRNITAASGRKFQSEELAQALPDTGSGPGLSVAYNGSAPRAL